MLLRIPKIKQTSLDVVWGPDLPHHAGPSQVLNDSLPGALPPWDGFLWNCHSEKLLGRMN